MTCTIVKELNVPENKEYKDIDLSIRITVELSGMGRKVMIAALEEAIRAGNLSDLSGSGSVVEMLKGIKRSI